MCVSRITDKRKEKLHDYELTVEMTRSVMALLANINRDKKQKALPYEGKDFFKLSYDEKMIPEADPDLMDRMKKRFGSKAIKKKRNG